MAQQTAVEWLIKRYHDYGTLYYEDITKAKEMEKEQLEKAYYTEYVTRPVGFLTRLMPIFHPFENYYNKTYKKES